MSLHLPPLELARGQSTPKRAAVAEVAAGPLSIENWLEDWRRRQGIPGASLAVAGPEGVRTLTSGLADREVGLAMTSRSRFLAGSVGKTFVSALALALQSEGRLDLDAPIARWVGEETWFSSLANAEQLTLRLLMTHRSGLPSHYNERFGWTVLPRLAQAEGFDFVRLLDPVAELPARFPPGEGWEYTDTAFVVAALTLEEVAGRSYFEQVEERFLRPLELADTAPQRGVEIPGLVQGYLLLGPDPAPIADPFLFPAGDGARLLRDGRLRLDPVFEYGGGGFVSTPADLARWARAFYGGSLLGERSLLELRREAAEIDPGAQGLAEPHRVGSARYGLGVYLLDTELGEMLGHWGVFIPHRTAIGYFPDHDLAVALMVNRAAENPVLFDALLDAAVRIVGARRSAENAPAPEG